jgi:hypothetical protein
MKRTRVAIGTVVAVGLGATAYAYLHTRLEARRDAEQWQALKGYCTDCHNAAEAAGNVVFEGVGPGGIAAKPEVFESAIRKLRGGLMPPPGNPRPDQQHIEEFVRFAESSIDRNAREPKAGYTSIQRLNRTEYAASVKDLLGVEIDARQYLPTEIEVDGFDNIAAALSVSPAFLEQYIGVARKVARLAVGEPAPKLASAYFAPRASRTRFRPTGSTGSRSATSTSVCTRARSRPSRRWSCCSTATRSTARSSAAARISRSSITAARPRAPRS